MTYLRCARCDVPLFDDPHWDDPELEPVCDGCCHACRIERLATFSSLGGEDAAAVPSPDAAAAIPSGTTSPAGVAAIGDRPGSAVRAGHLPFVGGELCAAGSQPGEDAHAVPATDVYPSTRNAPALSPQPGA